MASQFVSLMLVLLVKPSGLLRKRRSRRWYKASPEPVRRVELFTLGRQTREPCASFCEVTWKVTALSDAAVAFMRGDSVARCSCRMLI